MFLNAAPSEYMTIGLINDLECVGDDNNDAVLELLPFLFGDVSNRRMSIELAGM